METIKHHEKTRVHCQRRTHSLQYSFLFVFTHGPCSWNHGSSDGLFLLLLLLLLLLHTTNFWMQRQPLWTVQCGMAGGGGWGGCVWGGYLLYCRLWVLC